MPGADRVAVGDGNRKREAPRGVARVCYPATVMSHVIPDCPAWRGESSSPEICDLTLPRPFEVDGAETLSPQIKMTLFQNAGSYRGRFCSCACDVPSCVCLQPSRNRSGTSRSPYGIVAGG